MTIPAPRTGHVALVTGASSGIGREIARGLAAEGHDLVIAARRLDRLEDLATELRAHGRRVLPLGCDVSDPESREALLDAVADAGLTVDVLVLCAGYGAGGAFTSLDPAAVRGLVRTNVEGVMELAVRVAPGMQERRTGAILVVSSIVGNQPMPGLVAYAATKAAVTSFGEALHDELRDHGVTVSVLCPGEVDTEFAVVAGVDEITAAVPGFLRIDAESCARAGLDGLRDGRRKVVPLVPVKVLHAVGGLAPRRLWFRLARSLVT
ncbi:MAG: SDR family oxidoreductase [Solirubrobacteraceae bacterium]|nr:SDR family oxidoreductase [Solirubrobacteraceae bacterium]